MEAVELLKEPNVVAALQKPHVKRDVGEVFSMGTSMPPKGQNLALGGENHTLRTQKVQIQ